MKKSVAPASKASKKVESSEDDTEEVRLTTSSPAALHDPNLAISSRKATMIRMSSRSPRHRRRKSQKSRKSP